MTKRLMVAWLLVSLSGCSAGQIRAWNTRPVVEDTLGRVVSTVSLSSDRRTVIVVTEGGNKSRFCAEAPPDTAESLNASLKASIEARAKAETGAGTPVDGTVEATLQDDLETTVVVLAERTAALDAFRTGVYALCQYHLNGALTGLQLKDSFDKLVDKLNVNPRPAP